MTITGCLREAPSGATATSGSAASAPNATDAAGTKAATDAKFVLSDATESATGSPTGAQAAPGKTYRLIANDSALAPHVGKKLELTGTLDEAAGAGASASASAEPRLQVESGKVIAATCTP